MASYKQNKFILSGLMRIIMAPVYQSTILFPASTVTLSAISRIGVSISAVLQVSQSV